MDVSFSTSAKGGDILNPITILPTPGSATSGIAHAATATPSVAGDGALFKGQLGTFAALLAGKTTATPSSGAAVSADAELVRAVKAQLDRGDSLDDVIARLAGSLAASVAAQLGISTDAAKQRLTQAFTGALQSLGTGPPQSNAERASSLVARFRQMAELATRVTNGDSGQPIRTIAGTSLDAVSAKANPAPQTDRILREALDALAVPASPVPGATIVGSAVPAALAATSDGRTVALPAADAAIATGGDTLLGRILTRAALLDSSSTAAAAVLANGELHRAANLPRTATNPAGLGPADGTSAQTDALDAFLGAFASELARTDTAGSARHGADSSSATAATITAPLPGNPAVQQQQPLPFALNVARDAAPIVPTPPAPALPHTQPADANAVIEQILRGMAIRTTDGQSEVRLRLVPESLGDVSVKLIVSGGSVDASLVAHTADAQSALAGGAHQLAKTLADAGLKLQSFTVALAGGNFADARDQSRQHDAWTRPGSRRIGGVEPVDADAPDDASLLAVPSFGPPIYTARSLPGYFNYLA